MRRIFTGIFISFALLAGSGLRAWGVTAEFIDSLRTELRFRNMPERILFLPLALADQRSDEGREGIWSLTALDAIRGMGKLSGKISGQDDSWLAWSGHTCPSVMLSDSVDVRFDERISTGIALDRLCELFGKHQDWNSAIVAFATSPTALAVMDSAARADAPILRSLRKAEEEYSENIPAAFQRIGSLAAKRQEEWLRLRSEQAALQKARLDSLRKRQTESADRISYTIRRGDTLGGIAARHHVKVSDLKRWNNLKSDMIREGHKLVIYR